MYPGRYFNPRTPRGVRQREGALCRWRWGFQSTHPARGATPGWCAALPSYHYFNPRTPRGVRLLSRFALPRYAQISIHAPREGCDRELSGVDAVRHQFQSTHPARGATPWRLANSFPSTYFNPRTPRGVRHRFSGSPRPEISISIHAPREGCDIEQPGIGLGHLNFNPRTPRGVRPEAAVFWPAIPWNFNPRTPRGVRLCTSDVPEISAYAISIHAPREGCDIMLTNITTQRIHFNPRTPRGVRPGAGYSGGGQPIFQSTHPARGATWCWLFGWRSAYISIHAPREGCDFQPGINEPAAEYFNPRTPRGVRLQPGIRCFPQFDFNPRTPRGVRRFRPGGWDHSQ